MEIAQMQYFLALCEEKNYTRAAKRVFVTRQAMRQCVLALEKSYGVSLVENDRNRVRITPEGEELARGMRQVLAAYREMNLHFYEALAPEKPLQLGISRSMVPFYAPDVIREVEGFARDFPALHLTQSVFTSEEVLDGVASGSLDAGLVIGMGKIGREGVQTYVVREDPLVIAMGAGDALSRREVLENRDFAGRTLQLMSSPKVFFGPLAERLAGSGVRWQVVPDYMEASLHMTRDACLALDREKGMPQAASDPTVERRLSGEPLFLQVLLLTGMRPQGGTPALLERLGARRL